jgi:hypothetical protein
VQVWFSSTWSSNTLEAFRRAVTQLLTTASSLTPQQRKAAHLSADALSALDVLELLRHWQLKQVTLAAARSAWLDSADNSFVHLSNLRRKVDRLALTELALTGELRALGPGDTGSVVMFAVPRKFGERAFDECFLQVRGRQCMTFTCTRVPQARIQSQEWRPFVLCFWRSHIQAGLYLSTQPSAALSPNSHRNPAACN